MPPPPNTNNYARQTNHDPDATWTSTFKPLWNRTMSDHILFDAIAFDDLRGELSIQLMSTFSNRLAETIPISPHTKKPFSPDTLKKSLMACIWKLKSKFGTLLRADDPPLFPDADITAWCNQIKNSNRRSLMEGEDESNLFKSTFPIPTSHGPGLSFSLCMTFPMPSYGRRPDKLTLFIFPSHSSRRDGLMNSLNCC